MLCMQYNAFAYWLQSNNAGTINLIKMQKLLFYCKDCNLTLTNYKMNAFRFQGLQKMNKPLALSFDK